MSGRFFAQKGCGNWWTRGAAPTHAAAAAAGSDAAAAPATRIARRRLVDTPVCYYQAVVLPPKGVNGAWRIQKERPWCPDKWPLRRAQPFDRDPFRALPADVVGRVLENLVLDPYVRAVGHAPLNWLGVREWNNDEELVSLLSFAACSQACRRAARSDALWRERVALLERTYEPGPVDAALWRPRKN